jgi:preprotein translocase subunit SecF
MDFIGKRKIWFAISAFIIIAGIVSIIFQGLNLGIDFVGGNKYMLRYTNEDINTAQIRDVLNDFNLENSSIQKSDNNTYIIRTKVLTEEENNELLDSFEEKLGEMDVLSNEKVGPVIGKELRNKAFGALIVASIIMIIYITVRFEFRFAVAAIIALLHDVLITLGIFSFIQMEVNTSFVAAMLTIVGYSINDTIVVFDRIRENLSYKKKEDLSNMVNRSIKQILTRSINTSLTSVMALLALLIFGGETTKVFALAMIIGFISGTYSSIFVASPTWFVFKDKLLLGKK